MRSNFSWGWLAGPGICVRKRREGGGRGEQSRACRLVDGKFLDMGEATRIEDFLLVTEVMY